MGKFVSGGRAAAAVLKALGFANPGEYSRVVLVFDCRDVPRVYATKLVDADAALRVAETLAGAEVRVLDPAAVTEAEIAPPTVVGG